MRDIHYKPVKKKSIDIPYQLRVIYAPLLPVTHTHTEKKDPSKISNLGRKGKYFHTVLKN